MGVWLAGRERFQYLYGMFSYLARRAQGQELRDMKNMAVRGTIIMLAAVALIGAVVALRIAQATTHDREYTITVTPDKVLEHVSDTVSITVKVTVDEAFNVNKEVYWLVANENAGDFQCNFISSCIAPAKNAAVNSGGDFTAPITSNLVTINAGELTDQITSLDFQPFQDSMIESDEKIYLALCAD